MGEERFNVEQLVVTYFTSQSCLLSVINVRRSILHPGLTVADET